MVLSAAELVQRARQANGVSRATLARLADVSPSTVGRIELGRLDPTWSVLSGILEAAGYRVGVGVQSLGDLSAVSAGRSAFAELPDSARTPDMERWLERWRRAGVVDDRGLATNPQQLGTLVGNAARLTSRPGRTAAIAYERSWQNVAASLRDLGVRYAVTGVTALSPTRTTDGSSRPIVYVDEPAEIATRVGRPPLGMEPRVWLLPFDDDAREGITEDGDITFVSRVRALFDSYSGPGRMPDIADSVAPTLAPAR